MSKREFLKIKQYAEYLGVCIETVQDMIRDGRLPAKNIAKPGARKCWIIHISAIDALEGNQPPVPEATRVRRRKDEHVISFIK